MGVRRLRPHQHGAPRPHQRHDIRRVRRKQEHRRRCPIRHTRLHAVGRQGLRHLPRMVRRQRNRKRHRGRPFRSSQSFGQTIIVVPRPKRG